MKKTNTDNINIKIFLIVSTFYSTIIQTLFSIYYVTLVLFILLFIISYKEIFKELSNVKNKDYILLAPLFFLVYIVVQCFFYIKNINYNAIYIIGSSFVSIFYFYIFF